MALYAFTRSRRLREFIGSGSVVSPQPIPSQTGENTSLATQSSRDFTLWGRLGGMHRDSPTRTMICLARGDEQHRAVLDGRDRLVGEFGEPPRALGEPLPDDRRLVANSIARLYNRVPPATVKRLPHSVSSPHGQPRQSKLRTSSFGVRDPFGHDRPGTGSSRLERPFQRHCSPINELRRKLYSYSSRGENEAEIGSKEDLQIIEFRAATVHATVRRADLCQFWYKTRRSTYVCDS